jgi:hypothetical protein
MLKAAIPVGALFTVTLSACAMHRVPLSAPLAEPIPLRVEVCRGEFDDYARDGRDLLNALRERRIFREVGPVGSLGGSVDLVLAPQLGDARPRPALGVATLVPWFATATIFPWFVRSDREVKILVLEQAGGTDPCARKAAIAVTTGLIPNTQVMLGWTAPLVAMLPNWETTADHEFRPAIDSLLARRAELMEIAARRR